MVPHCSQCEQFSSISSLLLLSIFLSHSKYLSVSCQDLPPPENSISAQEQLLLNPFKTAHDEGLTCGQLIVSRGFKYERHFATTQDGYILQLYRIINPYAQAARGRNLKPILVVHGAPTSCSSFMINGPGGHIKEWINGNPPDDASKSLAFALANREYDTWYGNFRGTRYSHNHTELDPDEDPDFWDFSFPEYGKFDIPAMVDYIIQETGHEKIVYIGYSTGSIAMLVLLSKQPEFACKLDLNINIAPIAFAGNVKGIGSLLKSPIIGNLSRTSPAINGPLIPSLPAFDAFLSIFCTVDAFKPICYEIYNYLFGPDRKTVSPDQIKVLTSQVDQISRKIALHALQVIEYDQLREYDYGPETNLILYGSNEPPKFPFENIPPGNLVFISSLNDFAAPPVSVQDLRNILKGRPLVDHIVPLPFWSHTDILLSEKAFEYMHSVIINIIRTYGDNV